jgi:hypothetical protein
MAKDKMPIKYEKPPVHITASGSISIDAEDIFHSKVGQDVILRMATIKPLQEKVEKTRTSPTDVSENK